MPGLTEDKVLVWLIVAYSMQQHLYGSELGNSPKYVGLHSKHKKLLEVHAWKNLQACSLNHAIFSPPLQIYVISELHVDHVYRTMHIFWHTCRGPYLLS
jgi:hypothetical protein